ncbi:MAG: 30S ribosomal protein S20 [Thermodesulfovibrionales bacterium]
MPGKARPKKNLSALKRVRQSIKRNLRNKAIKTYLKTLVKNVESAVSSGNREDATKAFKEAIKAFSRAASKGIIHKNKVSRNISKLAKKVNSLFKAEAA